MPWGTKNMPPKKNLSRGSLSNWCDVDADADADADISKTIYVDPHPTGGVDIMSGAKLMRSARSVNEWYNKCYALINCHFQK